MTFESTHTDGHTKENLFKQMFLICNFSECKKSNENANAFFINSTRKKKITE